MKHSDDRFTGVAERSIYFQYWEPETSPRAVLLLVHGASEHSGRYQHLAQYFTGYNFAVAALDHNGHGYSEGTRGHLVAFEDYLHDLGTFHQQVEKHFSGIPKFLIGHSLGGLIGCNYLLQHQSEFAGCILSSAAIKTGLQPGRVQMLLIHFLALLVPRLGVMQLDANGVSRDPLEVNKYIEDPLVHHGKGSARLVRELFAGMEAVQARAAEITLPMLILHGGEDVMTAPEGSRFLHQHISSSDKTLKIYPGLYHEIFNEPEQAEVLADVMNWCEAHLLA